MNKRVVFKRGLLLSAMLLAFTGCATTKPPSIVTKTIPVHSKYNTLVSDGPFEIKLTRAPLGTPIRLVGRPESVGRTHVSFWGNTVYVSEKWWDIIPPGLVVVSVPIGDTTSFRAKLSDQSIMQAQRLKFETFHLRTYDVAHAQVQATQHLDIDARNESSVFYYGNPAEVAICRPKGTAEVEHFKQIPKN